MFASSYFAPRYFTGHYWPNGTDTPAPEIEVLVRGGGIGRKKRKREDIEYIPPEFNLDEAVNALFEEKPTPEEVLERSTLPSEVRDFEVVSELFSALRKPAEFKLPPDFYEQLRERDDEEAILLLLH